MVKMSVQITTHLALLKIKHSVSFDLVS